MDKKTAAAYKEVEGAIWEALKGKPRAVKDAVIQELGRGLCPSCARINVWKRTRYERRKAAGVCVACGGSKKGAGVRCDSCRERHNAYVNPDAKRRYKQQA